MLTKFFFPGFLGLAMTMLAGNGVMAQDDKRPGGHEAPSPEQMKAMMEMYEKAAKPGEPHKLLQKLAGKWNIVSKTSGMPGMPAEESKGTMENRSILDGRQIVGESRSTMMGKPFNGIQLLGYDNITKEYVSTWTDNWSTGHYMTRGTADATGKVLTLKGEIRDAMTPDQPRPWRLVIKVESDDKHIIEIYDTVAPETEMCVVTVTATRAK
jgi:hypothetical protein